MIRYRAILYMTRSYIPWVCYWTLSAFHIRFAPLVSLVTVLFILICEYSKKKYAVMDIVMFVYSVAAIIFNYLTPFEWFITGDGYIGYGTLTLMAVVSILIHRPFAKYYFEKEHFVSENDDRSAYLFSAIWMSVFFISTIIFWVVHIPAAAVISSNFFVLIGIVSSFRVMYIQKI